jgi:2-polyprenyl-6-hydroxyphenyl methylase/3-demethylubiquinone-9 3-methyltransferase
VAIVGAEYIMRYLPTGTHNWRDFVSPFELNSMAAIAHLQQLTEIGMSYNLFNKTWRITSNIDVNYIQIYKRLGISTSQN